ncbi:MAG: RlmE family RNA methyltransferase [bacterium]|nr:RlmE family RNA methyltransferase [bacterium]
MARYDRKDSYHQRAKREGYRSRAAYKLLELQEAQHVLRPGQLVADLGCWPGGWLQVAAQIVGSKGRVVGVDLAEMDPPLKLANVFAFTGDISEPSVLERILEPLGGRADVLLSDAAPKLTGVRATDRAREEALLDAVEAAIPTLLSDGGTLLVKLLDCPEAQAFQKRMRSQFESVRILKPKASRKGTTEKYLLGRAYSS